MAAYIKIKVRLSYLSMELVTMIVTHLISFYSNTATSLPQLGYLQEI